MSKKMVSLFVSYWYKKANGETGVQNATMDVEYPPKQIEHVTAIELSIEDEYLEYENVVIQNWIVL